MTREMACKRLLLLQRTGAQDPAPISRSSQPLAFVGAALMCTHPRSEIHKKIFFNELNIKGLINYFFLAIGVLRRNRLEPSVGVNLVSIMRCKFRRPCLVYPQLCLHGDLHKERRGCTRSRELFRAGSRMQGNADAGHRH